MLPDNSPHQHDTRSLHHLVGSCLLVPWDAQYNEDGLPKVTKLHNHHSPLINPKSKEAYPMYDVGNFTLDDTLFPRVPRDSFLYDGDVGDQLEQQGFDIPTCVDRCLWVTFVTLPIPPSAKTLDPTTRTIALPAPEPDSTKLMCSQRPEPSNALGSKMDSPKGKSKAALSREVAKTTDSPHKQPASPTPVYSNKEQHLDTPANPQGL